MMPKLSSIFLTLGLAAALARAEETPPTVLLVLNKGDNSLAIVDPTTLKVVGRAPAGADPHEVVGSADGKLAFISNYGGGHTLSVVDLVAQKALPAIELGALRSPHGLAAAEGKIYFTAEGSKVIGSYDPAAQKIDWVLGLGQNRTHMIAVGKDAKRIFTANVNSDSISIIDKSSSSGGPGGFGGPPPGGGPGGPPPDGGPGGPAPDFGPGGPPPGGGPGGPPPDGGPGGPPPGGPGDGNPPPGGPGGPPGGRGQGDWTITNISVGHGPEGFDLSPDGKEIWAANSHDGTLSVIDVEKKAAVETLKVPTRFANRLKFTPDGRLVFISDLGSNDLVVVEAASRKELKRIKLGGGSAGILMQPDGARAYVAVGSENGITVIDLKTLEVAGHINTGRGPDGLGWAVRN
jgi:YVTN family beta-propeller protein